MRMFLMCLLFAVPCMPAAHAAIYSVGGAGCTHASVQAAVAAAAANAGGPHVIRLPESTFSAFTGVVIANPQADITLEGGYANCAASAPQAGAYTTLDANDAARHIRITNTTATTRRLTLRQVILDRGSADIGGAIRADGRVVVVLDAETSVRRSSAQRGGGIAIGIADSGEAELRVQGGSSVRSNSASDAGTGGGGIFAGPYARVVLGPSRIEQNNAAGNGGGIHLAGPAASGMVVTPGEGTVSISNNRAHFGRPVVAGGGGEGGGIYAYRRGIFVDAPQGTTNRHGFTFVGNRAYSGGGVAARNDDQAGSEPALSFANTAFALNEAHDVGGAVFANGRVWIAIGHASTAPCPAFWLVGFTYSCSTFLANEAAAVSAEAAAGAIHFRMGSAPSSLLTVTRTEFRGNTSAGSVATILSYTDSLGGTTVVERSTFSGNAAQSVDSTGSRALASITGSLPTRFRYNTVLDNNVQNLLRAQNIDLQGSILWAPSATTNFAGATPTVAHNDCLVTRLGDQIPGFGDPARVFAIEPRIDPVFYRPAPASPAIDACDGLGFAPGEDYYRTAPFADTPGVPDRFGDAAGRHDLGAVERDDVLFFGGFGQRVPASTGPYDY